MEKRNFLRFLETLNFYRMAPQPAKLSDFRRGILKIKKMENQTETVRILAYCLMSNHFHLLVQQLADSGITQFLRKLSDSYTKYFNTKYQRIGPLFQGTFKAKLVDSDEYLLQLSKYIHRNPFELPLKMWEGKVYPYSSYGYYLSGEKHPFCDVDFILSFFNKKESNRDYKTFVEEIEFGEDPAFFDLLIDPKE